jgi:hypothetical protein
MDPAQIALEATRNALRGVWSRLLRIELVGLEEIRQVPRWEQSAWQRARLDISGWASRAPILFGAFVTAATGASVAAATVFPSSTLGTGLKIALGAGSAVGGFVVAVAVLTGGAWLLAFPRQRKEARLELARRASETVEAIPGATALRKRCREFADELDGVVQRAAFDVPPNDVEHAIRQLGTGRPLLAPAVEAALRLYIEGDYRMRGLVLVDEAIEAGIASREERKVVASPKSIPVVAAVFRRAADAEDAEAPAADESDCRRELLAQAHTVFTELETARYQLEEAKKRMRGWTSDDALPMARFAPWQESLATATRGTVTAALRGAYIWMERTNVEMAKREAAELNVVGTIARRLNGLTFFPADVEKIDEGISRIRNAQEHLQRLIGDNEA